MYEISKGSPILGCTVDDKGANFGIFSDIAPKMQLEIYKDGPQNACVKKIILNREEHVHEHIFHIYVQDVKEGMGYIWRIVDEAGNTSKPLLDPYAYGINNIKGEEGGYYNLVIGRHMSQSHKPQIPWKDTIVYEMHVGHFTNHDSSGICDAEKGTFAGLIKKLPYLKSLGVTTLELLPIFKWYPYTIHNVNPNTGAKLEDEWGYNTIGFFAVEERYSVAKESYGAYQEFKALVEAAHNLGMEIILDVVYNHTGEGGDNGALCSYKLLSPNTYYKFDQQGHYRNCSGTGNTFYTNHPVVKDLILESLRYWVECMGVDGFRFDLASILGQDYEGKWMKDSLLHDIARDEILSKVKLVTESWDAKGSYDVGRMPYPFREWSDYFRDTMRKFIKGDQGIVKSVADCMMGKEIYFADSQKDETHTLHFITAHDGFTLRDLCSYNNKHNLENGEGNQDGNNANYSYNWGIEGETTDTHILHRRLVAAKNAMCLLLMGKGVPMLLMGDEIGRSQNGNNNAFCQNHAGIWMNWEQVNSEAELYHFTKGLIQLRKTLKYFNTEEEYKVTWHGIHYGQPDWSYHSRSIAWHVQGEEQLYVVANLYHENLRFELPSGEEKWLRILDSHLPLNEDLKQELVTTSDYEVVGHSICIFKGVKSAQVPEKEVTAKEEQISKEASVKSC